MPSDIVLSPDDLGRLLESFPSHCKLRLGKANVGRGGPRASTAKAAVCDGSRKVGHVELRYSRIDPSVHVEEIYLDPPARGRDFGRSLIRHISRESKQLRQSAVTIEARDDGPYVWATLNFQFTTRTYPVLSPAEQQDVADELVRSRSSALARAFNPRPTSARELALAAGVDLWPQTPAELASLGENHRLGRLLFGSGKNFALWYGIEPFSC